MTGNHGKYTTLQIEELDSTVLQLTLDRPEHLNAINTVMIRELTSVFDELSKDSCHYRCLIITGAGPRAFCAGGDLKERNTMSDSEWRAQHVMMEKAMFLLYEIPFPIIAVINGAATGGGCELVLAADFAYAADNAFFALTETSLGIMPGAGGTQNLTRSAGPRRAKEIIFTASRFSTEEALSWGVINRIFEQEKLLEKSISIAKIIAANAPLSIRQAKKAIDNGAHLDRKTALNFEIEAYNRLIPTEDRREGIAAFNEKRPPVFLGR